MVGMRGRFTKLPPFLTLTFSERERKEGRPFLERSALPDLYVRERTEAVFGLKDYELAR
jgi:hypothetical protein